MVGTRKEAARAAKSLTALVLVAAAVPVAALAIPTTRTVETRLTQALDPGKVRVKIVRASSTRRVVHATLLVTAVRNTRARFVISPCFSGTRGKCGAVRISDTFPVDRGRNRIQRELALANTTRPCARIFVEERRTGRTIAIIKTRERAVRVCLP